MLLILQILAFFFLLIPYLLTILKVWKGNSNEFMIMNTIGSLFMCIIFLAKEDYIFFVLSFTWFIVGLGIIKKVIKHDKE